MSSQVKILSAQVGDEIETGPDKFNLFQSLTADRAFAVPLCFVGGRREEVLINTIQREDGTGQSWNVTASRLSKIGPQQYKFYYNSRTRKGTMMSVE